MTFEMFTSMMSLCEPALNMHSRLCPLYSPLFLTEGSSQVRNIICSLDLEESLGGTGVIDDNRLHELQAEDVVEARVEIPAIPYQVVVSSQL